MVITPCPHVDKDGRLRLRVDLTGVKGGRGALWHDVLWFFSTTGRSLCLHERMKDFLLARGAASEHNPPGGREARLQTLLALGAGPLREFRAGKNNCHMVGFGKHARVPRSFT